MRRGLIVAFALIGSLLVVSTTPAAAASAELAVGSQNTTDADFSNATTLNNVSVEGTGVSASVELAGPVATDNFDDGELDGWTVDGGYSTSTARSFSGDYALRHDGSPGGPYNATFDSPDTTSTEVSFWFNNNEIADQARPFWKLRDGSGTTFADVVVDDGGVVGDAGSIIFHDGGSYVDTGIDTSADTWFKVELINIDYANNQYDIRIKDENGVIGTYSGAAFKNPASEMGSFRVQTKGEVWWLDDLQIGAGASQGQYVSSNHSVEGAAEVATNLTLEGATATIEAQYWDGSQWQTGNQTTVSSTANHTLALSASATKWRTKVSFEETNSEGVAKLHDESYLFNPSAPTIENVQPEDNAYVNSSETLSADISDADFPAGQGDSVTAEFIVDGDVVGSETVSTNSTASVSWAPSTAGSVEYQVRATDSYGETTTSATRTLNVPNELVLRNESDPSEILNDTDGNASVIFYPDQGDDVYERPVKDGRVNLAGLPADEQFVAVISVDGFVSRRAVIDSILDQQSVYLLPESATKANVVFSLDDQTGRFAGNGAQLIVQKAINQSGDTEYRNIVGDRFGATGEVAVVLENDQRYRLRVRNDDGESRILESYTTAGDDQAPLPIGQIQLTTDIKAGTAFDAAIINRDTEPAIRIVYRDPAENTSSLEFEVRNENGTLIRPNTTETGPYGRYIETLPLGEDPEGHTYTISYRATRGDGSTEGGQKQVGAIGGLADSWNIDGEILSMLGWLTVFGAMGLTVLVDGRLAGVVGPVFAGALTIMEIIHPPIIAIGLAGGVGLLFLVGGGR